MCDILYYICDILKHHINLSKTKEDKYYLFFKSTLPLCTEEERYLFGGLEINKTKQKMFVSF